MTVLKDLGSLSFFLKVRPIYTNMVIYESNEPLSTRDSFHKRVASEITMRKRYWARFCLNLNRKMSDGV